MSTLKSLQLEGIGQIKKADIRLGDLTVLVGPQATGKSIFLQFLKLSLDTGYVHDQLRTHGIDWNRKIPEFLDVFLGEGMRALWRPGKDGSAITKNGLPLDMSELVIPRARSKKATTFYIPAQRVLSLANGWPKPFQAFAPEDPFVVRDFSETFRLLVSREFSRIENLFPQTRRLKVEYRNLLSENIFGGARLAVDKRALQNRLVLQVSESEESIPFMAWSAGQREFVPLLMGLYWLLPSTRVERRGDVDYVILEEPEMGLHPYAVSVVMLLVLELLWRGYKVCISTHSTEVLDVLWACSVIRKKDAGVSALLDIFKVKKTPAMKDVAEAALKKECRVYYFGRDGYTHDISHLDPGSEDMSEAGWGGLSEFSSRVNETVANVVNGKYRNKV